MDGKTRRASFAALVDGALHRLHARRPLRTGSFALTLWGDAVEPRGGALWLSSAVRILGSCGFGERLVRTTMTRLAAEGWFLREQRGRRSLYRTSPEAARRIRAAAARIYAVHGAARPLDWHVLVLPAGCGEPLRRELAWLGFGRLSADVWIHPDPDRERLFELLAREAADHPALIFRDPVPESTPEALRALGARAWDLGHLEEAYRGFLASFVPWREALAEGVPEPEDALRGRLLLIHAWRRIVLDDPLMPRGLLPPDWPGLAAFALCRELYAALLDPSERALDRLAPETRSGAAAAREVLLRRFGGLAALSAVA